MALNGGYKAKCPMLGDRTAGMTSQTTVLYI
jgi:hypothetical protein